MWRGVFTSMLIGLGAGLAMPARYDTYWAEVVGCSFALGSLYMIYYYFADKPMTDRYHSLHVTLAEDVREDDAQMLIMAIKALRGVIDVRGNVSDPTLMTAEIRVRTEQAQRLLEIADKATRK